MSKTMRPNPTQINPPGTETMSNHRYTPDPEPSSKREEWVKREVIKARSIGKMAINKPMRIKGILLMSALYES